MSKGWQINCPEIALPYQLERLSRLFTGEEIHVEPSEKDSLEGLPGELVAVVKTATIERVCGAGNYVEAFLHLHRRINKQMEIKGSLFYPEVRDDSLLRTEADVAGDVLFFRVAILEELPNPDDLIWHYCNTIYGLQIAFVKLLCDSSFNTSREELWLSCRGDVVGESLPAAMVGLKPDRCLAIGLFPAQQRFENHGTLVAITGRR